MRWSFTKRDLTAAALGACAVACTLGFAQAASTAVGSSVYPWEAMKVVKTPVGETRQVLKAPTATLEELELHITTLNPGQSSHPPHHHPNEELIIIDKGTVETLSKGKWERLGPGSMILNASEDWHSLRNVGAEPAQYHVINWRTPATDAIAAKQGNSSAAPQGAHQ